MLERQRVRTGPWWADADEAFWSPSLVQFDFPADAAREWGLWLNSGGAGMSGMLRRDDDFRVAVLLAFGGISLSGIHVTPGLLG